MKRFGTVAAPIGVGFLVMFLPIGIISAGAAFATQILAEQGLVDADMMPVLSGLTQAFSNVITLLVEAYFIPGFVNLALKAARGQPTSFGDAFSGGRWFGKQLVSMIVGAIITAIGYVLCLVPGVIVALGISLSSLLIVDQDLSGVDALKRSWEMTKGHKLNIFLWGLIGIFVYLAGVLACGFGALFVSIPMALVGVAYIYLKIKGENPPVPT